MSNSYERELVSRQSNGQPEHGFPTSYRPNTATKNNQLTVHVPITMISGKPTSQLGYGRTSQSAPRPSTGHHRPASQLGSYRPPSQSGYRPPSQSGNRPPSQSCYRPPSQSNNFHRMDRAPNYLTETETEIVYPEPICQDEDQQIFVRKPRQTTVTPPVFRLGSHGAPWKHVRSVINSNGSHLCWIDGAVKQDENMFFPMYWDRQPARRVYRVQKPPTLLRNSYNQQFSNGYTMQRIPETKYTDYSKFPLQSYNPVSCGV